jgi:hypothetical protein
MPCRHLLVLPRLPRQRRRQLVGLVHGHRVPTAQRAGCRGGGGAGDCGGGTGDSQMAVPPVPVCRY